MSKFDVFLTGGDFAQPGDRLVEFYYAHGPRWALAVRRNPEPGVLVCSGLDVVVVFLRSVDLADPWARTGF